MIKGTPPSAADWDAAFDELVRKLQAWKIPSTALERVHDGAKASLSEVKALTEYEDGKISRLLTIIAFLSAVVGAVFTRFATDYPWPGFRAPATNVLSALTIAAYLAFFAYVLVVTASVLFILGAVKPRFKVPKSWSNSAREGLPPSMLFYERILDVTAPNWGEAFIKLGTDKGDDLKAYYARCYIAESYLVAGKVAEKLRLLSPGVDALRVAMGILLLFFVLFGANVMLVNSPHAVSGRRATIGPISDPTGSPQAPAGVSAAVTTPTAPVAGPSATPAAPQVSPPEPPAAPTLQK
ncbi:hypothetical protein BSZ21_07350 [Bradyrhizobium canariense]|uniref:hypothetical protein n=1 Tax=Bradyrhizobium canariense TaxID=255045 RepID=UPI000A192AAF|nr:hypothetical protein [Bradyrhizobium canariense]OSI72290.1 hypothetical protein BSZ21_07350 [Bradyrhizobium canariense]